MILPAAAHSPWQRLYGAVLERRRAVWRGRAARLPRPVVSIGNLHWGGGGKTPLVAAIARALRDEGRSVVILSRGYRRRGGSDPELVSRGDGPLLEVARAGDEPHLLARQLPGVAVVVGADRQAAAETALRMLNRVDLFLLDDGFSHVRLGRDLDLLVFPAVDPFAGGRLLPSGRLREPLGASRWADAAILTGLAPGEPRDAAELGAALRRFGFDGPAFAASESAQLADDLRDLPVLLVSAVARPAAVERTARRLGLEVVEHLGFADHHPYPPRSLARIRRRASALDARVVTTSKDLPKLERLGLPVVELRLEVEPEPALFDWLRARL
jgi:tetraacyldisaccharide 4'-kinase